MGEEILRLKLLKALQELKMKNEKIQDLEQKFLCLVNQISENAGKIYTQTSSDSVSELISDSTSEFSNESTSESPNIIQELEEMRQILEEKQKEFRQWKEKIAEMNEQSNEIQEQMRKIMKYKQELEEKEAKIEILEKLNKKNESTITNLISKIKVLEQDNMHQKYENERLRIGLENVSMEKIELATKIPAYKSKIIELMKNAKIQRREIRALNEKIELNNL